MDNKELELQVKKVVEALFNEKEEAKIREATEVELKKSATVISDLTVALEGKNEEVAGLETTISENNESIANLTSELEAAKENIEKANTELSEVKLELEGMKKDRAAELRMAVLEDAGVIRTDRDAQTLKVREMNDEEFASYKEELVSIRQSILLEIEAAAAKKIELEKAKELDNNTQDSNSLETSAKTPAKEDKTDEEKMMDEEEEEGKKKEKCSEGKEEASEVGDTVPADINLIQAEQAALNMEYVPSASTAKKYNELGAALAKMWAKK